MSEHPVSIFIRRVSKLPNFSSFSFFFFQMTSTWKMRDKYGMDGKFDWKG